MRPFLHLLPLPPILLLACSALPLWAQTGPEGKPGPSAPVSAPADSGRDWQAEVELFDGKSLIGWEGETKSVWRVVDGVITGGTMAGNPRNEFLASEKEYRDFILTLEYRLNGTEGFVNGGVQFRSKRIAEPAHEMSGYQADIGAGFSGYLYDESRRNRALAAADKDLIAKLEKPGDWNRYEIRCEGPRIRIALNGVTTVDWTEAEAGMAMSGKIALQIHGNCKAVIEFRNLQISEAEPRSDAPRPLSDAETMRRFGDWKPRPPRGPFPDGKFTLESDETVAFLGGGREARQGESGFLEFWLARAFSRQAPRFRWMAASGDTVYQQAREMNFGSWTGQLQWAGASVVVCRFGRMESLDGEARLPEFKAAYHRLLDLIKPVTQRIVLLIPMVAEDPPDASEQETTRRMDLMMKYTKAVMEVAREAGVICVGPGELTHFAPPPLELFKGGDWTFSGGAGAPFYIDAAATALGLGASAAETPSMEALAEIAEKNRLWTDCWRPDNWAFAYGDRMNQLFGKQSRDGAPFLREEYEMLKPRVAELDARIAARAGYQPLPPVSPEPTPAEASVAALSAEDEQAAFTMADGFEVNLFASEKDGVVKPIQMSWDERGRMLIACSPMYPHLEPGTKPGDSIVMCEDTDGDGRVDKSWKFAGGFTMVQGVEPGNGGVYVCDFDRLTFLKDTDDDGRADSREVIYTGFGTGDTHQLINSIGHGDDGALWFTQGLHNLAAVETPYGIRRLERAGVWRLDPVTLRLERFFNRHAAGMNCWGVAFDDYGQIFHKSGDRPAGYWSVPGLIPLENPDDYDAIGAIFQTNPKTTALEFIGTAAMPDALQGCAITAGFMGSVMEAFPLTDDGAGFKSGPPVRLLTSKTDAFRPVDVSVGPDGAIYVCDFYNPIIGHYQASYRDPARDHGHGRIWRITAKGRPSVKPPDLAKMDAPALLAQLGSGERWTRNQARRLLGGFPADEVTTALRAWFAAVGDRPENHVREALCVARSHHWPENSGAGEALAKLAASQDFRFRAAAALMAGETPEGRKLLTGTLITDPHPRVRLCAAVALAQGNLSAPVPVAALVAVTAGPAANSLGNAISSTSASAADDKPAFAANSPATAFTAAAALAKARSTETALALAKALDLPRDRFLDYALTQSFRFLLTNGTVAADAISFAKPEHRAFALKAAGGALTEKPAGQVIYETICLNCHQADAKGLPGIYPPLTASPRVNGPPEALAKILLHGLTGPLANFPQNTPVPVPMPPTGLTDQQIADVLTWLRTSFGNQSPAITPDQIRAVRQATSPYQPMWTAREL